MPNDKENKDTKKIIKELLSEILGLDRASNKELESSVDLSKELAEQVGFTLDQKQSILNTEKDIAKMQANSANTEKKVLDNKRSESDIQEDLTDAIKNHKKLDEQRLNLSDQIKKATKDGNFEGAQHLRNIFKGLGQTRKANEDVIKQLDREKKLRKDIDDKLGNSYKLVKALKDIPIVGKLIDTNKVMETMNKKASEMNEKGELMNSKFDVMKAGIIEIGKEIKKGITDPFVVLSAMSFAGKSFNKDMTNFRRNMGITYSESEKLRTNMTKVANDTRMWTAKVTSKETTEAIGKLNDQFGTASTIIRDDIVGEMAALGKLTKMSAESQANFARYANISGKNAEVITKETRRAVVNMEQEKGVRLDINKIMDQAGKVNGQIAMQLKGNVTAIAETIALAQQYGMTLDQVAKSGQQLLNFEQSISNELEAELLTGKQLNLEKARLAALTGDYQTLTKEINANVGDFTDFSKMNVLQQQAIAKSVGMTADELSDVLLKEENIEQLAQEARDAGDEKLAKQLEARSVQEKFNDALMQMKQLFVDIVGGPIGMFLSGLGEALGFISKILSMIGLGETGIGKWAVTAGILLFTFGKLRNLFGVGRKMLKGMWMWSKRGLVMARKKLGFSKLHNAQRRRGIGLSLGGAAADKMGLRTQQKRTAFSFGEMAAKMGSKTFGVGALIGVGIAAAAIGALLALATRAKDGADFVTSGPMPLIVGDNPGGKERVSVTPIGSENKFGPGNQSVDVSGLENEQKTTNNLLAELLKKPTYEGIWEGRGQNNGSVAIGTLNHGIVGDSNSFV